MKLETFFDKFDQFVDVPNAVLKMRELVLDLAFRGKLVPQNLADEPTSELLKCIHAEKIRRKIRVEPGDEKTTAISRDVDFEIPSKWEWVGATAPAVMVSDKGKKVQTKDILDVGKYPVVDQGKIFIRGYCNDSDRVIRVAEPIVLFGDHTRETKLIDFDFVVGADGVKLLQPICIDPRFYFLALRWLPLESRGYARHFKLLKTARIPLPPLAEQKRIVAKVDELMALCDRLETQQHKRETQHTALSRASLARFAEAPTPDNLNFIFHKSYDIKPANLRKFILTLAVQGKLVPQDLNDEAAFALLEGIEAQKSSLAKVGNFRGSTSVRPMADDETDFELPPNWCWVRFGEIMINRDGERIPVSKEERDTKAKTYDYYGASGVIDKIDNYLFDKPLLLIGEDGANLISRSTPIAFIARGKYWVNNHAHVLDGISEDFLRYIELYINAINLERYVTGSAQPKMNQAKMNSIPIALPPLAEQRRIVAKVEQLTALVDELETQLVASQATSKRLVEIVVAELQSAA